MQVGDVLLAHDSYLVLGQIVHRRIALSDPGIDDSRNDFLWSPASPTLIDVILELKDGEGNILDCVRTYTALREIATQGDRVILNGRAYRLRMVLDQGYWPESGMTAPDDLALQTRRRTRQGHGLQRRSQAPEDRRSRATSTGATGWACWCGRRCRAPTGSRRSSVRRLQKEWEEVITRDCEPCVRRGVGPVQRILGRAQPA